MAETRTARMRLVQWSEGTDSPQRVDFNETFLNIENSALIFDRGRFADRPNPTKRGHVYEAQDQGILYYSDGASWVVLGANVTSQYTKSANTSSPALIVAGIAGQLADISRVLRGDGTQAQRIRNNGDLLHGPLQVRAASKPVTADTVVPDDSAVTIDVDGSLWAQTLRVVAGNTQGFIRAVRGGSTVFSVSSDGSVNARMLTVAGTPTDPNDVARKQDVDAITARKVDTGDGLLGGGTLDQTRTLRADFLTTGTYNGSTTKVARADHSHKLTDLDASGFYPGPSTLPGSTDPNTMQNPGIYTFNTRTTGANWPKNNRWGVLEVVVGGSAGVQRFTDTQDGRVYTRYGMSDGTWSAWLPTGGDTVVTIQEMGGWRHDIPGGGIIVSYGDNGQRRAYYQGRVVRTAEGFTHDRRPFQHGVMIPSAVRRDSGGPIYVPGQVEYTPCIVNLDIKTGSIATDTGSASPYLPTGGAIYFSASWWF